MRTVRVESRCRPLSPWWKSLGLLACLVLAAPARADTAQSDGRFVTVPSPLSGEAVERILASVNDEVERFIKVNSQLPIEDRRDFTVVLDFNPEGTASNSDQYEYCLRLANGIRELNQKPRVRTLAFVHGEVGRHSILPVLACKLVAMSSKATLRSVVRDDKTPLPDDVKASYRRLSFVLTDPALLEKFFEPSTTPVFNFDKAEKFRLCGKDPCESRQEVARVYRLLETSLRENPLIKGTVAALIPVNGEVNGALKERLERRIRRATGKKANLIILELKCRGGDPAVANSIGEYLADFNKNREDNPVEFIALVTPTAQDTAVYLALGCSYIVMDPKATLGGFNKLLQERTDENLKEVGAGIEKLAQKRYYPPSLCRAFVDRTVRNLFLATSTKGVSEKAIFTGRQLDEEKRKRPGYWDEKPIELKEGFLTLTAEQARDLGLAYQIATLDQLKTTKAIRSDDLMVLGDDWLDDVAHFLRTEWVQWLLVMIGITCLLLEVKMPGIGLPGIVAAVCFVLFFWSSAAGISGQLIWLAVLLFLLGLILLGVEIFLLPGFGVCGISGIVLVLGSLALVAYGRWPQNSTEWVGLSKQIAPFGLSLIGSVVLAIILARYLPSLPYVNRLILKPHEEGMGSELDDGPRSAFAGLLGAIGVANTPLRPAGKVQFGDQFVDVVAEGAYIVPGTRVQVIEVEGNRVVVKAV